MKQRALWMAMLAALALPAQAQRVSLADRVTALEARANAPSPNVELMQQLEELRAEVRSLRAQIEEMQHANEEAASRAKTQYVDLDTRIGKLETAATAPVVVEPVGASVNVQPTGPALPATPAERNAYEAALAALKAGDYVKSSRAFADFLGKYPNGAYAPNALYWLGESYYVTENYELALQQFQSLVQRYPTHDKTPGALLKVGLSQLGMKNEAAGRATLQEVAKRFPGTDAARAANERLKPRPAPKK